MTCSRRHWRSVVRATTVVGVPTATGIVAGAAVAGAVVLVGVLAWALVRWPRWEDRVFRPRTEVELRQPEWAPPRPMPGRGEALGPDGHRAFAQALHAVTAAYLAECEREARR